MGERGMKLHEYGIFQEKSDIRAHVSDKVVFIFKTEKAVQALNDNKCPQVFAYQTGYDKPTAKGYLLKPELIKDVRVLYFDDNLGWQQYYDDMSTTQKGKWAVNCVIDLLKTARFPLWIDAKENIDVKMDIEGTDILIFSNKRIQVKCDYPAHRTGNLYMQTHEINPFKNH